MAALVCVDVQYDYFPGGSLACAGADAILAPLGAVLQRAPASFCAVAATQDAKEARPAGDAYWSKWPPHCVVGTRGQEMHAALAAALPAGARRFAKAAAQNAFHEGSGLAPFLRAQGARAVVVCGLALEYCVLATALGAADAGFPTVVIVREGSAAFGTEADKVEGKIAALVAEKQGKTGVRVHVVATFEEALAVVAAAAR